MSTHNICFHGEIRKISAFFQMKKVLISCYEIVEELNERDRKERGTGMKVRKQKK